MIELGIETMYYSLFGKKQGIIKRNIFDNSNVFGVFASIHRSK